MISIHNKGFYSISDLFVNGGHQIGYWANRGITLIQSIPNTVYLNRNPLLFLIANVISISAVNYLINNHLKKVTENHIGKDERKTALLNCSVVTVTAAVFNYGLSKALKYPLSATSLTMISTAATAIFILLNREVYYPEKKKPENEGDTPVDSTDNSGKEDQDPLDKKNSSAPTEVENASIYDSEENMESTDSNDDQEKLNTKNGDNNAVISDVCDGEGDIFMPTGESSK